MSDFYCQQLGKQQEITLHILIQLTALPAIAYNSLFILLTMYGTMCAYQSFFAIEVCWPYCTVTTVVACH